MEASCIFFSLINLHLGLQSLKSKPWGVSAGSDNRDLLVVFKVDKLAFRMLMKLAQVPASYQKTTTAHGVLCSFSDHLWF